ncbi:MAG TPA: tRNA uridine-5-carboxymethylaminomethyl(34) synthesis GTPase MnmE [Candidatus Margulisiibacteriota bacterium]|nr:tRNA uridine-5-carboxymethylaminomethyl(34) synthesis GTPase MnmE [Candidatus Margulisiibacteriota bacterium]
MYTDDTIAAIATPPGHGGIGIIRVSGPLAPRILAALFVRSHNRDEWLSHHLYHGRIVAAEGTVADEGLAVLMRAPHSFTGDDVVELHCHGSPVGLRRILARILAAGARLAEPGEFTRRAFLNGRIDLTQAEAVIDLVRAGTTAAAALAAEQLLGRLAEYCADLRDRVIRLKALLEAQIDFAEEDFDVGVEELLATVDECIVPIEALLDTYQRGKVMRDGVRVAIIGKPNVGKSSLLNALLGEERAIVTPIAGTTRDAIDEPVDFDGVPVVLSDTAGLRDAAAADTVERLGMQRTAHRISEAQVLLTVLDASRALDSEDDAVLQAHASAKQIIVLNKVDLPPVTLEADVGKLANHHPVVRVSATQHLGLAELRRTVLAQISCDRPVPNLPVLANLRHVDALTKARGSLRLARESIAARRPPDLVAVDVQDAIDHISTVTGAISSEDVLDRIFSEFCIGK